MTTKVDEQQSTPETISVPYYILEEIGQICIAGMAQDSKKSPPEALYQIECLIYGIDRCLRPALDQYRADKAYVIGPKIILDDTSPTNFRFGGTD